VGEADDRPAESDGYATGLIVYVLRQAGVAANQEPIRRGVDWLKTHQRASGCWFTHSIRADGEHHIANTGTAFALMALRACGAADN
jgi:squalene-hopene/tetraprenyl-beta-curcumene cyclase